MRTSRVLISSSALKSNYLKIANLVSPSVVVPVVKANAYGHGLSDVVSLLESVGVNFFATAFIGEAIQIRKNGFKGRLISLGSFNADELIASDGFDIELVCYCLESIQLIQTNCKSQQKVHLKIDTGMCRLGVWFSEVDEFFDKIKLADKVKVIGICTHFAKSESSRDATILQNERFKPIVDKAKKLFGSIDVHASNSAASLYYDDLRYDFCRVGLAMFGIDENLIQQPFPTEPVMSIESRLVSVKKIPQNESVSYGGTYKLSADSYVAVVPIGYGDGYSRRLSNSGQVIISEKLYPIIGNICMDQFMVLLGNDRYPIGEPVVLLGQMGSCSITANDLARWARISPYEITTCLLPRIDRFLT